MKLSRRKFCQVGAVTVGTVASLAVLGCEDQKKKEEQKQTKVGKGIIEGASESLLKRVRTTSPDEFTMRYLYALAMASRAEDFRLPDGQGAEDFIAQASSGERGERLARFNQKGFVSLALGKVPENLDQREEVLARLLNDATFANDNTALLQSAALNRVLEDSGYKTVPGELTKALRDQLQTNSTSQGWGRFARDTKTENVYPTVDNNSWAVLAGVADSRLIDSYGRLGPGWSHFFTGDTGVQKKTNVVSTVLAGWGRGFLAAESWELILSCQKTDGGFGSVAGADESNAVATAEVLAFVAGIDHEVFGRYLDTQKNNLGVFYLSMNLTRR